MITVQSNLFTVRKDLEALLADLSSVDKILNRATFDSFAMIKQRVQQRGEKSDNSDIGQYAGAKSRKTKSGNSITAISGWAKIRQDAGRQIGYIDLTFSGDMMDRGFSVIEIDESTIAIGFLNDTEGNKARWLEQRFGAIFQNTEQELSDFVATVITEIEQQLK